jgi:hypothetical protein
VQIVGDRSKARITSFNRSCYTDGSLWRCEGTTLTDIWGNRQYRAGDELPANLQARADEFQVNDEGFLVWVGPGNNWTEGMSKKLWGTFTTINGVRYDWGFPIVQRDSTGAKARVKIGDFRPDVTLGFRNTFRWRAFRAHVLFNGQIGGQIYNNAKMSALTALRHVENDQSQKPDSLKKPRQYYSQAGGLTDGNADYLETFLEDGTWMKLSEVQVSYQLPDNWVRSVRALGISSARVALNGRNLYTFTRYSGVDPETGTALRRIDNFGYPTYRNYTLSLNVRF